jgi:hypothetical protein
MFSNAGKQWEAYLPTVLATGDEGWLEISTTTTEHECSICQCETRTNNATYVVAKPDGSLVNNLLSVCTDCAFIISFGYGEEG